MALTCGDVIRPDAIACRTPPIRLTLDSPSETDTVSVAREPVDAHPEVTSCFAEARLTSTVLDLPREIPNIRAFALRRWHDAGRVLRERPYDKTPIVAERASFWDWGLLELLLNSGLRIEEACELTAFDVLRRSLPDGRLYYLLHIKPSKFGRARVPNR